MKLTPHLLFCSLALFAGAALGADWQNISDSVTSQVKAGEYGPTAGVVVDRLEGTVFMVVNDQGLWRSSDHGATFERCADGKTIGRRCETGSALQADPAGPHLACFMVYGGSAITRDGGRTWTKFTTSHFDFGSVDWADSGQRFLAMRHESGGMLTTTSDGGAPGRISARASRAVASSTIIPLSPPRKRSRAFSAAPMRARAGPRFLPNRPPPACRSCSMAPLIGSRERES